MNKTEQENSLETKTTVVWLKRDLRTQDHRALYEASQTSKPYAVYIFNPDQMGWKDFDIRHWTFIFQSLNDLRNQGLAINTFFGRPDKVFNEIKKQVGDFNILSHEESGTEDSWAVDKNLKKWCCTNKVVWREYQTNAVIRGLKNRNSWDATWIKAMRSPQSPSFNQHMFKYLKNDDFKIPDEILTQIFSSNYHMITGGETKAKHLLETFLNEKVDQYWGSLSYPEKSRYYCSFLSAHIAYGNISLRTIYQACEKIRSGKSNKKSIDQYMARLKWHCHFIQKFEMDTSIQYKNMNSAFNGMRDKVDKKLLKAWKNGMTGYPLIDAAMRCVKETGYLNFRLRSTVVSFLTHILWQPWKPGADYLAKMFLDYEPGIHYPQFQMQAATTGIHTVRIYNPIKQSLEKDSKAIFIKKWIPELRELPVHLTHCPWEVTPMEEDMYNFKYGKSYPKKIVHFEEKQKVAREKLWGTKSSPKSIKQSKEILKSHGRRSKNR